MAIDNMQLENKFVVSESGPFSYTIQYTVQYRVRGQCHPFRLNLLARGIVANCDKPGTQKNRIMIVNLLAVVLAKKY